MEHSDYIKLINSRSWDKRLDALEGTELSPPSDILLLSARACLTDSNDQVRSASADTIGRLGSSRDRYRLLIASRDPSWLVRSSVADAFGYLRITGSAARVEEMFTCDSHSVVRRDAACALIHVTDHADCILRHCLLTEDDEIVRIAIHYSLYALGDQSALIAGLTHLRNEDEIVRCHGQQELATCTNTHHYLIFTCPTNEGHSLIC